ncbi:hypothetical protein [Limosilactobacillus kribbianus]|uniref:hypothetical protein n=1 Tax=Limosilactobacillus kribbianus TaxID=2982695 RepID=UPI002263D3B5|nr:hypothetical protein [Limosilactobacillus kribbianus]
MPICTPAQALDANLEGPQKKLRKNALFLYLAQQQNDPIAAEVYRWFDQDLIFINPAAAIPAQLLSLMKDPDLKHEMVSFLNFADFNISDITVRRIPLNVPDELTKVMNQLGSPEPPHSMLQLYTIHKSYDEHGNVIGTEELPLSAEIGRDSKAVCHCAGNYFFTDQ